MGDAESACIVGKIRNLEKSLLLDFSLKRL